MKYKKSKNDIVNEYIENLDQELPIFGRSIPDLTENFRAFAGGLKAQAKKGRPG